MLSLFMGFWSMLFAKVQYQILILGLDDAGKTTFLEQVRHLYSGTSPPEDLKIPPTVGLNIGKLDVSRVRFIFWDLGGSASLRVLWDKYYADSHAVLFLIDSTADDGRMDEAKEEIRRIATDKDLIGAPIILLANKQDLKHATQVDALAKMLQLPHDSTTITPSHSLSSARSASSSKHSVITPSSSSSSSSLAASTSSSTSSSASPASSSSASAASLSSSPPSSSSSSSLYGDHLMKLLPISALTGSGIRRVIDLLMQFLPKMPRTLLMKERNA